MLADRCRQPSYQGSDNKESMEGPGAKSNNKQQFNDCHDASAGPGAAIKGQADVTAQQARPDTRLAGDHSRD